MRTLKQKFTSRKFIVAVFGIIAGAICIATGNVTQGSTTIITSILAYLVAEGYIDAKSVQNITQGVADNMKPEESEGVEND